MLTLRPSLGRPLAASALLMVALLSACSDSIAPAASPLDQLAIPALPAVVASDAVVAERAELPATFDQRHTTMASLYPSDAVTYKFTATPGSTKTWILGQHMLKMPMWTICDPSQSTYGPGTWKDNCVLLKSKISIYATTWTDLQGHPRVDFQNALRFIPNAAGELPVIYLLDASASLTSWGRIDYCYGILVCVNEAALDPVLVTKRDSVTGFLFRIIRHFSGYNVWA
jgi:hypothetical protein